MGTKYSRRNGIWREKCFSSGTEYGSEKGVEEDLFFLFFGDGVPYDVVLP